MRPNKSHELHMLEMNTRVILENSPLGSMFRINGMGKLIPKDRAHPSSVRNHNYQSQRSVSGLNATYSQQPDLNAAYSQQPDLSTNLPNNPSLNNQPNLGASFYPKPDEQNSSQPRLQGNPQPQTSSLFDSSIH